jgi:hypothetical protein
MELGAVAGPQYRLGALAGGTPAAARLFPDDDCTAMLLYLCAQVRGNCTCQDLVHLCNYVIYHLSTHRAPESQE